ncbi:ricin-type beta-trefoil lectin domain protein [Streptomyces sp. NPDC048527]|uniref:ricin-type beta-trefoil lectin domain protein n=1 Tax=Streptomyces sp. NPDC048527 TaxID=3365568 RepID=UPI00371A3AB7
MTVARARSADAATSGRRRTGIRLALLAAPTGVALAATVLVSAPAQADTGGNAGPINGYGGCLDVWNATTENFAPVQSFSCNGTDAQKWTLDTSGNTLHALGKCLDVYHGGTDDGTTVELYDCNGTGAQVWIPQSNGAFYNPQSNKCLDDSNWSTGSIAQIWDCSGNANQSWNMSANMGRQG